MKEFYDHFRLTESNDRSLKEFSLVVADQNFATPWAGLDPRSSCTDEFTRFDRETVHVANAEAYNCDF